MYFVSEYAGEVQVRTARREAEDCEMDGQNRLRIVVHKYGELK